MPIVKINGNDLEVESGITVLQACEIAGIEIPRFCYHERLAIAGNCRMCLVQVEGGPPKPVASCAMPVADKMVIHTDTPMVKKAREGVMEFLLINHPLDCPICDQGGECDLQDQAMVYGKGNSRYKEHKRAVVDKYMGPLIKTHMTRCIHCTRCIRFSREVAGVDELGAIGRGEHMEVTTYVGKAITSEFSGNLADICPVGALTSRPYAYKARPWEIRKFESIDVMDAVGSNIRIDVKGREVMRILPILNEEINEEWISDKTRYSYDALKLQRLDAPMMKINGHLQEVSWEEAFSDFEKQLSQISPDEIAVITGDMVDVETLTALKDFVKQLGIKHYDGRPENMDFNVLERMDYLYNPTIANTSKADVCLMVGANPRYDAPIINLKLRQAYLQGNFKAASVGLIDDQTYPVDILSDNLNVLQDIYDEKHPFSNIFKNAKNPLLILGEHALNTEHSKQIHALCKNIALKFNLIREDWNGFGILHRSASNTGVFESSFFTNDGMSTKEILDATKSQKFKILYLVGCDNIDLSSMSNTYIIYQGHHGDRSAHHANLILPSATYTEKYATYINLEGRAQRTTQTVPLIGHSRYDFQIIIDLMKHLKTASSYQNIDEIREDMKQNIAAVQHLGYITQNISTQTPPMQHTSIESVINAKVDNFYMTNSISRASKIMAKCYAELVLNIEEVIA